MRTRRWILLFFIICAVGSSFGVLRKGNEYLNKITTNGCGYNKIFNVKKKTRWNYKKE